MITLELDMNLTRSEEAELEMIAASDPDITAIYFEVRGPCELVHIKLADCRRTGSGTPQSICDYIDGLGVHFERLRSLHRAA